jgi:hypothetical protein
MGSVAQQIVNSETVPLPLPLLVRKIAADPSIPLSIWAPRMQPVPQYKLPEKYEGPIPPDKSLLIYNPPLLKTPQVWIHFMFDELNMCGPLPGSGTHISSSRSPQFMTLMLS